MTNLTPNWPEDADGDVFRGLAESGFDFSQKWKVDYNVDFGSWPPPGAALELLRSLHGPISLYAPEEGGAGYALFQVVGPVTYESVVSIQRRTSAAMQPFGGVCESWGVLH